MSPRVAACLAVLAAACGGPAPSTPAPLPRVAAGAGAGTAWFPSGGRLSGVAADGQAMTLAAAPIVNAGNGSGALRSADGGSLYVVSGGRVVVASAADGHVVRALTTAGAGPLLGSVSPDGRWLWLANGETIRLVDVQRGAEVASGTVASGGGSTPFSPALLALGDGRLVVIARGRGDLQVVSAQGQQLRVDARVHTAGLGCYSPDPSTLRAVASGTAVVGYCAYDGAVWWFDLTGLRLVGRVTARIGNPFWGSPVFSPDGTRLYVYDSWDGDVSTIDLVRRRVVASARPIPAAAALRLPFVSDAYAKGPNFSAALSADGSTLLALTPRGSGFHALATTTWAVRGGWLDGHRLVAVWAGGDGSAVFAAEANAGGLDVVDLTTGLVRAVAGDARGGFATG